MAAHSSVNLLFINLLNCDWINGKPPPVCRMSDSPGPSAEALTDSVQSTRTRQQLLRAYKELPQKQTSEVNRLGRGPPPPLPPPPLPAPPPLALRHQQLGSRGVEYCLSAVITELSRSAASPDAHRRLRMTDSFRLQRRREKNETK